MPMTDEQRETLGRQLADLDEAIAGLEATRKPFDDAISVVYGVKEELLGAHDAEIVGRCETCMEPIFAGDLAWTDGSGEITLCEAHAPTWGDELAGARNDDAWEHPQHKEDFIALAEIKPADEKHVWEH